MSTVFKPVEQYKSTMHFLYKDTCAKPSASICIDIRSAYIYIYIYKSHNIYKRIRHCRGVITILKTVEPLAPDEIDNAALLWGDETNVEGP